MYTVVSYMLAIREERPDVSPERFEKIEALLYDTVMEARKKREPVTIGGPADMLRVYPNGDIEHLEPCIKWF